MSTTSEGENGPRKKSRKFKSQYFKTAYDLVQAKDDAWSPVATKRERLETVRKFVNMVPTLSTEEKEALNRSEANNFGTLYRDLIQNVSMYTSMVTGTNQLVEIVVDTDNPELDTDIGIKMSDFINRGAIYRRGRFPRFWSKVAGEFTITGGAPVVHNPKYGWCPDVKVDMFFPRETDLDSEQVSYAFDPCELSMAQLKELKSGVKKDDGSIYNVEALDYLIEALKQQIARTSGKTTRDFGHERTKSVRDEEEFDTAASISAWWYYEVKWHTTGSKRGESYVSATLFTDGINEVVFPMRSRSEQESAEVIVYIDKAFQSATEFLECACVDSEIGGVKNIDTLRGIGEMIFPAALELEELFNLQLEGDKMRAKPRYQVGNDYDEDEILRWNSMYDTIVPKGVVEMEHKSTSNGLMAPISMLRQTAASIAGAPVANQGRNGGELRQQALERQESNATISGAKLADAYISLDAILETVVYRILAAPVKPGTQGYQEIMWIRDKMKAAGIDYEKLAERKYGAFVYLKVRARRVIGAGNRDEQLAVGKLLMDNIINYDPAVRPVILHRFTSIATQDPDLADTLAPMRQPIINKQKVTAENERDTIRARVALGQVLPVMPGDIHQDHIPVHLLDAHALIARNDVEPWRKIDALEFAGIIEHASDHIAILVSNPKTNPEAKPYLRTLANLIAAASPIIKELDAQEGVEQTQLTAKEQADLELKSSAEQRKWIELGMAAEDMKRIWGQRASREMLSARKQYSSEVQNSQRLKLDTARTAADIEAKRQSSEQSSDQS